MIGITASPIAIPPTNEFKREAYPKISWKYVAITISAKNPITTLGSPASSSMTGLITSRSRRGANVLVNIAASIAIGAANKRAMSVTLSEPIKSGTNPYLGN